MEITRTTTKVLVQILLLAGLLSVVHASAGFGLTPPWAWGGGVFLRLAPDGAGAVARGRRDRIPRRSSSGSSRSSPRRPGYSCRSRSRFGRSSGAERVRPGSSGDRRGSPGVHRRRARGRDPREGRGEAASLDRGLRRHPRAGSHDPEDGRRLHRRGRVGPDLADLFVARSIPASPSSGGPSTRSSARCTSRTARGDAPGSRPPSPSPRETYFVPETKKVFRAAAGVPAPAPLDRDRRGRVRRRLGSRHGRGSARGDRRRDLRTSTRTSGRRSLRPGTAPTRSRARRTSGPYASSSARTGGGGVHALSAGSSPRASVTSRRPGERRTGSRRLLFTVEEADRRRVHRGRRRAAHSSRAQLTAQEDRQRIVGRPRGRPRAGPAPRVRALLRAGEVAVVGRPTRASPRSSTASSARRSRSSPTSRRPRESASSGWRGVRAPRSRSWTPRESTSRSIG